MKNAKQVKTILAIVGVSLLGLILLTFLVINVTLIIKGAVNKDLPPDICGTAPLAVVSPSMSGSNPDSFGEGALIYVRLLNDEEKQSLEKGDIVCFRDDDTFVTHRIITVNKENGKTVSFVTMGDFNNTDDGTIMIENVIGICTGSVEKLGNFAIFLQTPWGILVFIGIPVVAFIIYDVLRIRAANKKARAEEAKNQSDEQIRSQEEEIRRLQEMLAQQQAKNSTDGNVSEDSETKEVSESSADNNVSDGAENVNSNATNGNANDTSDNR